MMNGERCLLFHLLGIVFNLISSLDDLIRPTVELVWDDLLKVLECSEETKPDKWRETSCIYGTSLQPACLTQLLP